MNNFEAIFQLIQKLKPEVKVTSEDVKKLLSDNYGYSQEQINDMDAGSMPGLVRDILRNQNIAATFDWKYNVSDIFYALGMMLGTDFPFDEPTRATTFNGKEYRDEIYEPTEKNFDQILEEINEVTRNDYNKELLLLSSMGDYYQVLLKPTGVQLTEEEKKLLEY